MTLRKAKAMRRIVVEARTRSVKVTVRNSGRKGKEGKGRIVLGGWVWHSRWRSRWKGVVWRRVKVAYSWEVYNVRAD